MQLTGELSKVSLPNLIQLVRNGELSGKIALSQGAKSATIYVTQGSIVHVEADANMGREVLMELFLWLTGSFSFIEADVSNIDYTLNPYSVEDSTERLLRDGMAYVEQKKYLDHLRVSGQTVLKPTEQVKLTPARLMNKVKAVLERLDGATCLADVLASASLSKREAVQQVWALLSEGLAVVVDAVAPPHPEQVDLPPWVIARLKQDNANISQSIVDMVIWVDRVKCWMYQVDADFGKIIGQLARYVEVGETEEDFWKEIEQDGAHYQGPLFGEAIIEDHVAGNSPRPTRPHAANKGEATSGRGAASDFTSTRAPGSNQSRRPSLNNTLPSNPLPSNPSASNPSANDPSGNNPSGNNPSPGGPSSSGSSSSNPSPNNPSGSPSHTPSLDDLKGRRKPPSVEF